MSTYSAIDMDIELTEEQRRERNPTERGRAYNVERKWSACLSMQRKLTRQINKIDLLATDYDNSHIVQRELQMLVTMLDELKETYRCWYDVLRTNKEKSDRIMWYNEQKKRVSEFNRDMEGWLAEAKRRIEVPFDELYFTPSRASGSDRSKSISSKGSSVSSKLKESLKVAELRTKAATLERRQELENKTEKLLLEEQLAIAEARERVYSQVEDPDTKDDMNTYYNEMTSKYVPATLASTGAFKNVTSSTTP